MKAKKVMVTVLAAAALVTASVFGTMAYLTDSEAVTNTFTVGNVTIDLNETDVDKDGDTKANKYHLIPGQKYTKDPTVTMGANSENAYVFMTVDVKDYNNLTRVFDDAEYYQNGMFLLETLCNGWDKTTWACVDFGTATEDDGSTTATYRFRYNGVATAGQTLDALFDEIEVPGEDVDETNIDYLKDVKIIANAYAVQEAGFDTADDAWAATFGK